MKHSWIFLFCFCVTFFSKAQSLASSVIGSAGEQSSSASGFLDWTLGEILTETFEKNNGFFTQGFQQPTAIMATGLEESEAINLVVYPNPARDILYVKIIENGDFLIELFDMQGQKLVNINSSGVTGMHIHQMDLTGFSVAMYLLRIANTSNGKNTYHNIEKN